MNAVLQYAIDHQPKARNLLYTCYGVAVDDVEDVAQTVLLAILKADPEPLNPKAYWSMAVRSAAMGYHQYPLRKPVERLTSDGIPDARQDPETAIECREEIRRVWDQAKRGERRAIVEILTNPARLRDTTKVRMSELRRRLAATA